MRDTPRSGVGRSFNLDGSPLTPTRRSLKTSAGKPLESDGAAIVLHRSSLSSGVGCGGQLTGMRQRTKPYVRQIRALTSAWARSRFDRKLAFRTDCDIVRLHIENEFLVCATRKTEFKRSPAISRAPQGRRARRSKPACRNRRAPGISRSLVLPLFRCDRCEHVL